MRDELEALEAQHDELAGMVDGLTSDGWATPSQCEGWSVSDVLLHLAQTDEMALASLDDELPAHLERVADVWAGAASVDDGAGLLVAAERGTRTDDEVLGRWLAATARLRQRLAARNDSDRVQWVAGTLSVRTLAVTRLSECWIHTGDIAAGLGVDQPVTDRLQHIARLAWRTLPYAFARAGLPAPGRVTFELDGPAGAHWQYADGDAEPAPTVVRGPALDLCLVAGQRAKASETELVASGPDADAVLELVRTFA